MSASADSALPDFTAVPLADPDAAVVVADEAEAVVHRGSNRGVPGLVLVGLGMATVDSNSGQVVPYEVERITVYVVCKKTDSIVTLHPIRLMREHYRVNGKRLAKVDPQQPSQIPTNEFAFDVLAKNIR